MAPGNVTSARSSEELIETVIPVLSIGSRITLEVSKPPLSRVATQKSPQRSVPTRPRKETASPSRANPIAHMAEALPSTIAKSSARISLLGAGNALHPCRIMSGLSSPATRILAIESEVGIRSAVPLLTSYENKGDRLARTRTARGQSGFTLGGESQNGPPRG